MVEASKHLLYLALARFLQQQRRLERDGLRIVWIFFENRSHQRRRLLIPALCAQHFHHLLPISPVVFGVLLLALAILFERLSKLADPDVEIAYSETRLGELLRIRNQPLYGGFHLGLPIVPVVMKGELQEISTFAGIVLHLLL